MHAILPSFYPDFQCRANNCKHSCCKGWEIDIDEDTARKYRTMSGPLADEIRSHTLEENGTMHFVLDPNGNCPMLRKDGLCRLILARGEEDLCDICALHPRFFEDCGDFELWGLGLSCEETCDLLLSSSLAFTMDDLPEEYSFRELLDLLCVPFTEEALTFRPMDSREQCLSLLALLRKTEPIDTNWIPELRALEKELTGQSTLAISDSGHRIQLQKLYSYFQYRQLERLKSFSFFQISAFARACTQYILLNDLVYGRDSEHIRRLSEQIEYSEENTLLLLSQADVI